MSKRERISLAVTIDERSLINSLREGNETQGDYIDRLVEDWQKSSDPVPTMPLPSLRSGINKAAINLNKGGIADKLLFCGGLQEPAKKTLRRIIVSESTKKRIKKEQKKLDKIMT